MNKLKEKQGIRALEDSILEHYNAEVINTTPKTENELLKAYQMYTDELYQYLRVTVNHFMHALNNEIRAMLGHLSEYRSSNTSPGKRDLEKAYGHFRRLNLDALKILCDEFDRSLSKILKKQSRYDYRDVHIDYLKDFGEKYIDAKNAYIKAQKEERVGCDSHTHNIIELYYDAAKSYILLKQFYNDNKRITAKVQSRTNIKALLTAIMALFGIVVSVLDLFF